MKTSQAGVDLIKDFEQLVLNAYMPTPNDVPTLGFGHVLGVKMGMECTPEEAEEWLKEDLVEAEDAVNRLVHVPLSQNQFDALVSFVFNIGVHGFAKSTLLRLLNSGDRKGAAEQLLRWDKQSGITLRGLTRRRQAEKAMFEGAR